MKSRMEKYYHDDLSEFERTRKNADLYKKVYGDYQELENLPIPDNVNEIDITKVKKIIDNRDDYKKIKEYQSITTSKEITIDTPEIIAKEDKKTYDINELLEKAKIENSKLKKQNEELMKVNYKFLETLENSNVTKENDINEEMILKTKEELDEMDNKPLKLEKQPLSNDTKYETKQINVDPEINQVMSTQSLPLDLLNDLKPTKENTIVSIPINEEEKLEKTASFYSGSHSFSNKDFTEFEELQEKEHNHYFIKILLLIIGLAILATIGYYVLKYYGII